MDHLRAIVDIQALRLLPGGFGEGDTVEADANEKGLTFRTT